MPPTNAPGPVPGPTPGAGPGEVPADIAAFVHEIWDWARFLGIDVGPQVTKFVQLYQTNPEAIWGGSDQLGGVAGGLDTEEGDLSRVGADINASGMVGQTRDAIVKAGSDLVGEVTAIAGAARQLAGSLGQAATSLAESKSAAVELTGATAIALRMLRT